MNIGTIVKAVGGFFVTLFKGIFTSDEAKVIEGNFIDFVKTDVGKLAVDAVQVVSATMPQADGVTKRDAAVAQLIADAKAAGKDLTPLATSTLNWFVETALQAVLAHVTTLAAGVVL